MERSAPAFQSAGFVAVTEPDPNANVDIEDASEAEDDDDDEASFRPSLGLGFGARAGLGAGGSGGSDGPSAASPASFLLSRGGADKDKGRKTVFDGSTALGRGFVPSSSRDALNDEKFVQNIGEDGTRRDEARPNIVARPSAFGGRGGRGGAKAQSFGARMMARMGYVDGQGLGKENQGRNIIITAPLRPQGVGLGAVREKTKQEREEEKRQARLRGETPAESDSDSDAGRRRKAKRKLGSAGSGTSPADSGSAGRGTPKRARKMKYVTADEVARAAPALHIPQAFSAVLDMTGPGGGRVLPGGSGSLTPSAGGFETAEQAEARRLTGRAQAELAAFVDEWKALDERKALAELELHHERQEIERVDADVGRLATLAVALDGLELAPVGQQQRNGAQGWRDRWNAVVEALKQVHPPEKSAVAGVVSDIAVAAIHPIMTQAMVNWDPLEDPDLLATDLAAIKALFKFTAKDETALNTLDAFTASPLVAAETYRQHRKSTTPYESMMYRIWYPKASATIREWNAHEPYPMLAFFEGWKGLLPEFVRVQFLEQGIVRKLDEAVAAYNPRKSKHHGLTHLWIFPWLQYLPPHHSDPKSKYGLISDIRRKYRQIIDGWRFDKGLVPGLKEWRPVFESGGNDQWTPLLMNHVLPSMARYLRKNFEVDQADQEPYLAGLIGVFEWLEILPANMVAEVVVAEVFPKWHTVLYKWLVSEDPNYDEIGQWFSWWSDDVFPEEIKTLPTVVAEFDRGADLISRALELGDGARERLKPPQRTPAFKPPKPKPKKANEEEGATSAQPPPLHKPAAPPDQPSFRDRIEDWCLANDLQFLPERRRAHEQGHVLFRITERMDGKGGALVYFVGDDQMWVENVAKGKKAGGDMLIRDSEEGLTDLLERVLN